MSVEKIFAFQRNEVNPGYSLMFDYSTGKYFRGDLCDLLRVSLIRTMSSEPGSDECLKHHHSFIGLSHPFTLILEDDVIAQIKQAREEFGHGQTGDFFQIAFGKIAKMNLVGDFMTSLHITRFSAVMSTRNVPFYRLDAKMDFDGAAEFTFTIKC